jgi:hypothetical protein
MSLGEELDAPGGEACRAQPVAVLVGPVESVGKGEALEELVPLRLCAERLHLFNDRSGISRTGHLGDEASTGPERPRNSGQDRPMVDDPVEGGVREDEVELGVEAELTGIGLAEAEVEVARRWERVAREAHHLGREVDTEHAPGRHEASQLGGHLAVAAPDVQDAFGAGEPQFAEQLARPSLLLGRVTVVVPGVPTWHFPSAPTIHHLSACPSCALELQ